MVDSMQKWVVIGAVFLALGVCLGAFGAHGLKERLDVGMMAIYEKAVLYHFIHALGLLLIVILSKQGLVASEQAAKICAVLSFGILVFSGSLYLLAITGIKILGAITPLGGTAFIIAWCWLAWTAWKN